MTYVIIATVNIKHHENFARIVEFKRETKKSPIIAASMEIAPI